MSQDMIRYSIEKSSENITFKKITEKSDWEMVSRDFFDGISSYQKDGKKDLKSVYEKAIQNYLILLSSQDLSTIKERVSSYASLPCPENDVILNFYQKNPEISIEYSLRGHLRASIKTINKANGLEEFDIYAENILDVFVRKLSSDPSLSGGAKEDFLKDLDIISPALDKKCFDKLEIYRKKIFDD